MNIKISSSDVIATNGITSGIVDEIEYPIEMSIFTKTVGISLSSIELNVAWFDNLVSGMGPVNAKPTTVPSDQSNMPMNDVGVQSEHVQRY